MTKNDFIALGIDEELAQLAADASEEELRALRIDCAIRLAVPDAQDADIVAGLIDREKLTVGEDGTVTGLEEQLAALRQNKPFLFRTQETIAPFRVGAAQEKRGAGVGRSAGQLSMRDAIAAKLGGNY